MSTRIIPLLFLLLLSACGSQAPPVPVSPNRWSDERLIPVLDAQEHRDSEKLCAFLNNTAETVREAAALALASVRDTTCIPCLLKMLDDGSAMVRSNAVFALGYIADSATVQRMAEKAANERDTLVQRSYLRASFIAMQRNGLLKDTNAILYFLDHSSGADRVRAADALRRLPDSTLLAMEAEYLKLVEVEADADVKATLIRGLARMRSDTRLPILRNSIVQGQPLAVRVNAIRALAAAQDKKILDELIPLISDPEPVVRMTVAESLETPHGALSAGLLLSQNASIDRRDLLTRISLFGMLMRSTPDRNSALDSLKEVGPQGPYAEAARIKAMAQDEASMPDQGLRSIMFGTGHSAVRLAAFEALAHRTAVRMTIPRAISGDMQVAQAAPFYHSVFESGDVGLICAVAEQLQMTSREHLAILFPKNIEEKATATLQPIRDLEALIMVEKLAQRRDLGDDEYMRHGKTEGTGKFGRVPFNHPIDIARLRQLKQGQQYRIVTTKGEITISTDVNECPSSSLAFDSLVTAGYYNGKSFHRMVPNFVVQGGCPRGDGYGGMPWTLRTEIGRTPFTAGSVGFASAGADTESCQFFITHSAAPHLDGRYTRFGEVVSGMNVVWKLQVGDVMQKVERSVQDPVQE